MATANREHLVLWDLATGGEIARLDHGDDQAPTLAFRGDGALLSASPDGQLGTWDLSWIADGSYFHIVCGLLPDYRFATASKEYNITIDEPVCGDGYDPPLPGSK